ncbi:flagellar basal body protein FlgE [Aeromonas simiae]|uniref:flagellar hook protein FlgE n=1 Tax=Aeromonas simiae TaxID=218936 RepID=UPI00266B5D80|nr:flagellar hook protein FlgE [Aeromonas simiae]MDO2948360.1 flagellar basal body protein FlgE [Aeromonas simiae]MDO2955743.1 flagellar basal body protein FlgE [Aeromonas simiae]
MSFNIGLSGLRSVNQELGVISNNIANVNTAGFKSSRAEFAALYSGGQAGGVEMTNASQNFDRNGDMTSTGRALDLAISGNGFFVLKGADGQESYTRAGMFQRDANNYLVTPSGDRLQGYSVNDDGTLQSGVVGDIQVNSANLPAKASTELDFNANLKADAAAIDPAENPFSPSDSSSFNFSQSSKVYDSLGVEHTLTQYFVKTGDNEWEVHASFDGEEMDSVMAMTFNTDGSMATPTSNPVLNLSPSGADPIELTVDISRVTQYASDFNVSRNQSDGYTSGEMTGLSVDTDGCVYAQYTNGQSLLQGQVVMAGFTNPNGLLQADGTTWKQSFSSGQPVIGVPGSGALGSLTAGAYESSNVDLTGELVNLMTAQRNYQANAKTISAANQMSQVLFNTL